DNVKAISNIELAKPVEVVKSAVDIKPAADIKPVVAQEKLFEQPIKASLAVQPADKAPLVLMPKNNEVIEAKPVPVQIVEQKVDAVKPAIAESDKQTSSWFGSIFSSKKEDVKEMATKESIKANEELVKVAPVVTPKPITVAVPPAVVSVEKPPVVAEDTKSKISDDVSVLATPYEPVIKLTPPREDSDNAGSDVRYLGESRYSGRVQQGGN
ncbi:MAG: hypothetical protein WCL30_03000, partial [Pseudomonadota bacterium]